MSVTLLYLCCFVMEVFLFVFHQETPQDLAARRGHEEVVAFLKRDADPNMLEKVCETVPLRIVVVSSEEALTLTHHSCHLFHM